MVFVFFKLPNIVKETHCIDLNFGFVLDLISDKA